mgnify:CR=1 FL=1
MERLCNTVTQAELDAARLIKTTTYVNGFFLCVVKKCTGDLDLDNYAKVTADVASGPTEPYSTSTAPTTETVTASDFESVEVTCPTGLVERVSPGLADIEVFVLVEITRLINGRDGDHGAQF